VPAIRVIPCLDVAGGRVVKGVKFKGLRDAGDPVDLSANYYQQGADELTFLDVTAAHENRATTREIVTRCAEEVFIPLTVGGGIRNLDDVSAMLEAGADKVSIGSAGVARPELLREVSSEHGNQILVVSLDIKRGATSSGFTITSHGGKNDTGLDAIEWVTKVQDLGAGELLINSMDADGTREGFDLELIELVLAETSIPIIASGGAGNVEHFVQAARAGADALLAASVFHSGEIAISDLKLELAKAGIEVR